MKGKSKFFEAIIAQPSEKKVLDPLIGLELTFSNESTKKDFGDKGVIGFEASNRFKEFLGNIQKAFQASSVEVFSEKDESSYHEFAVTAELAEVSKDLGDGEKIHDLRVEITDEKEVKFWFNISRDPQVIEIQTMPVKVSELQNAESVAVAALGKLFEILESSKYGDAKLSPSKEGGGHINVDAKMGGLLNAEAILKLIELWNQKLVKESDEKIIEHEPQTAALIDDSRYFRNEKKFDNVVQDRSAALLDALKSTLEKALKNYKIATKDDEDPNKKEREEVAAIYWKYPQVRLFPALLSDYSKTSDEREKKVCIHNQAINLEHLFEGKEEQRRIEFRNFIAQGSVEQILKCWTVIEEQLFKIEHIKNNFTKLPRETAIEVVKSEMVEKPNASVKPLKEINLQEQCLGRG